MILRVKIFRLSKKLRFRGGNEENVLAQVVKKIPRLSKSYVGQITTIQVKQNVASKYLGQINTT